MLRVQYITTEDEDDLIVSFALAPAAHKSLTLLRSPQYDDIVEAKKVLRKMVKDGVANVDGA